LLVFLAWIGDFTHENGGLRAENTYFWNFYPEKSMR
jgi:hypothetical protein